jgi:hypothetical protein
MVAMVAVLLERDYAGMRWWEWCWVVQGAIMTVRRLADATWNMRNRRWREMLEARKKIGLREC